MPMNRDPIATDYLRFCRIIKDLHFHKYSHDKETKIRKLIDEAIATLEKVKHELANNINNKAGKI